MASLWQSNTPSTQINLGKGHPNPSLLPLSAISEAFSRVSTLPSSPVTLLQYGPMQGHPSLRNAIANLLRRAAPNAKHPNPDNLLVTTGSGPALSVIVQLFVKPGGIVVMDRPGYFLAYYAMRDSRVKVVEVDTDHNGLDVDAIEKMLRKGDKIDMVYTVPIGNNPTGVGMSEDRKKKLVALAREFNFKIASDEVYTFLRFASKEIPTSLFEYDLPDQPVVFAVNSFSKLLGPGLRLGWIATHEPHMSRLLDCGALQSGGGFNPFVSEIVADLLDKGFVEEHAAKLRNHYAQTCSVLCEAIDKHVGAALNDGEKVTFEKPEGGFFLFVRLPDRFDCDRLLSKAKEHGVSFFAGKHFTNDGNGLRNCIRLCFAFCKLDEILEGVKRLAIAIKNYDVDDVPMMEEES